LWGLFFCRCRSCPSPVLQGEQMASIRKHGDKWQARIQRRGHPRRVRALVQRGSSLPNRWTTELPSHGFWQPLRKRSFHPCIPRYRARGAYGD